MGMLTVFFCDRDTGTGNRSRPRSARRGRTGTQIDITAAHAAGALLAHGAVRSGRAVGCHFAAADTYAHPPKVSICLISLKAALCAIARGLSFSLRDASICPIEKYSAVRERENASLHVARCRVCSRDVCCGGRKV